MRWGRSKGSGFPHLTLTLSAPEGGEGMMAPPFKAPYFSAIGSSPASSATSSVTRCMIRPNRTVSADM